MFAHSANFSRNIQLASMCFEEIGRTGENRIFDIHRDFICAEEPSVRFMLSVTGPDLEFFGENSETVFVTAIEDGRILTEVRCLKFRLGDFLTVMSMGARPTHESAAYDSLLKKFADHICRYRNEIDAEECDDRYVLFALIEKGAEYKALRCICYQILKDNNIQGIPAFEFFDMSDTSYLEDDGCMELDLFADSFVGELFADNFEIWESGGRTGLAKFENFS